MSAAPAKRAAKHPIPDAALDDRLAFVGTSGSGKTYAAGTAVERLLESDARVVIVDPLGVWHGLRLDADGKTPAFPVVIFGGEHADLPLTEHAGALIGETAATMAESCILDLSDLGTKASERRFMLAFLTALYRKTPGEPLHVVFDEADMFAPQVVSDKDGEAVKLLGMMETIVRRGRIKGFVPWLITQRPAVLNKNVLSQADGLIALKLTSSQDRGALGDWIEGQADRAEGKRILGEMPTLQRGQAVVWMPARGVLTTAQFPMKATFDSSRTPARGEAKRTLKLKPLDLDALKAKLETVEAEIKANDPKALRTEVAKLRRDLAAAEAKAQAPSPSAQAADAIRKQAFAEGAASRDDEVAAAYRKGFDDAAEQASRAVSTLNAPPPPKPAPPRAPADVKPLARPAPAYAPPPPAPPREPRAPQPAPSGEDWIEAARKLWPATLSWAQLGATIGKKASGGYFYSMRKGLLESGQVREAAGRVVLTSPPDTSGVPAADILSQALPEPSRKMFVALRAQPMAAADLAATLGMKPSGGYWFNGLSILRTAELIEDHGGVLCIAPHLERA